MVKRKLSGCKKRYQTGQEVLEVLKGVDLEIHDNEFVMILGESGCGKTTLLNILGGIDEMDEGRFFVQDKELSHAPKEVLADYRRRHVGYVFQESGLMPNLTALENIQLLASLGEGGIDPEQYLDAVGLSDKKDCFPEELSLGQRQRVAIARALAKRPDLILADEPTASLDPKTGRTILKLLADTVRKEQIALVMTSHDVEYTVFADRVFEFEDGRLRLR